MRRVVGIVVASSLFVAAATGVAVAQQSGAPPQWRTFGDAHWQPHVGNNSQHGLVTSSVEAVPADISSLTYGGMNMLNPPSDPASITALSFDFTSNVTGNSGGSPRMDVSWSDGGSSSLRPLTLDASAGYQTIDGMTGSNWDNNYGGCGYRYATTWSAVVACHPGATITGIDVVNDSGWLYPAGETITLDNITVNNTVATGPGNST
jgi:hypothetical protein